MAEYVFLFRANPEESMRSLSPEQRQSRTQAWMAWIRELEAKGHLKNAGQPLEVSSGKVVRGGKPLVTDGPYAEVKDLVLGFTVIAARDLEQAAELAGGCPILASRTGSVEVRPVMELRPGG